MSEFFTIVGMLVWIIVTALLFIGAGVAFMDIGPATGTLAALAAVLSLAGIIYLAGSQSDTAMNRCMDSGRAWAIIGSHTELRYNAATKTSTPQRVTDYGCVERTQ